MAGGMVGFPIKEGGQGGAGDDGVAIEAEGEGFGFGGGGAGFPVVGLVFLGAVERQHGAPVLAIGFGAEGEAFGFLIEAGNFLVEAGELGVEEFDGGIRFGEELGGIGLADEAGGEGIGGFFAGAAEADDVSTQGAEVIPPGGGVYSGHGFGRWR